MSKISVIVPVYNVERHLKKCIDSIINQTYKNLEIILVDDGSTDMSSEICDEYALIDSRVRVIHKENGGVSSSRNIGLDEASGEYVMFVDSDDYIDTEMMSDMMLQTPCDIIYCGLRYVLPDENCIGISTMESYSMVDMKTFIDYYYRNAEELNLISASYNKLFLKSVIDSSCIRFDEKISLAEDSLFVMEFLSNSKTIACISKPYYSYVQYGAETLISRYNDSAFETCEKLYNAKVSFSRLSPDCEISFLNKKFLDHYIAYISHIYSRSCLKSVEKYRKLKQVIKNEFLRFLLNKNAICGLKVKLISIAVKTGCVLPLHILYGIRWMRRNIS